MVTPEEVTDFLNPLPIRVIPGIGPKTEKFLNDKKLRTVADLRPISESSFVEWFGKWGARLFEKVRGVDDSCVEAETPRRPARSHPGTRRYTCRLVVDR